MPQSNETYRLITHAERPISDDVQEKIVGEGWSPFMREDNIANLYFGHLYDDLAHCQFALYDADDNVVAIGNSVSFNWDGNLDSLSPQGWDWVLQKGVTECLAGITANTLSAISITVATSHKGSGVSRQAVAGMQHIARQNGLSALFAPVRPNLKSRYPLTPMENYVQWTNDDGAPFDPWLRTHWRLGAKIIKVCPESMRISDSVESWEKWTGMRFPESGDYVVPDALNPIQINRKTEEGCYIEPNVWMQHTLSEKDA